MRRNLLLIAILVCVICLIAAIVCCVSMVFADDVSTDVAITYVWDGDHPIKDSLSAKTTKEASLTRATAVYDKISKLELPYKFSEGDTTIVVKKIAYDEKRRVYGTWIEATRDDKEIYTRSPIWVHNSPIIVETNRVQTTEKTVAVTLKEDLLAVYRGVMLDYVANQPLGQSEGDDTLIIYSNNDGYLSEIVGGESFVDIRADDGYGVTQDDLTPAIMYNRGDSIENYFDRMGRYIVTFDTSALSGATLSSGTITLNYYDKTDGLGQPGIGVTGCTPADETSIAVGDYDSFLDTELTNKIAYGDWDGAEVFTLNANGLAYIDKEGYTSFMPRSTWDIANSFGGVWGSGSYSRIRILGHGDATEANRPKLTVEYTPGGGSAPVAAFSANVTEGYPPFNIAFTDSSTNTPTSWYWLFGDGDNDNAQNPTHTYDSVIGNTPTSYSVSLNASNTYGSDDETKTDYITAYPLLTNFTVNTTSGCAPLHVGFTDTTGNGTPSAWSWNFGGDGASSDQNPTHTFNTPGTYWVSLNASNAYSWDIETKTALITVNSPPVAAFTADKTVGCPPLQVAFTDTSTGIGLSNWSWDFNNDGTPDSYNQNPTHTFSSSGTYTVKLTVTGTCGSDSEVKTNYITVSSGTVSADFSADDTTVYTGVDVHFTDLSTGGPTSWQWSWGDETANGTTQNPTHSYSNPGDYTVSLTATNDCGGSDSETKVEYINVTAAPTPTPTTTATTATPTPTPTGTIPVQGDVDTGRISPLGFVMLAFLNLGLVLHTFVNNESRNYLHVFTGIVAVIVSFLLGTFLITGFVQEDFVVTAAEVTVNSSVLSTYQVEQVSIIDAGVGYYFVFIGILMTLIVILSVIEIIREIQEG